MTFIARLTTHRTLERAVQFFGASKEQMDTTAKKWIEAHGEAGEWFDIFEVREVSVGRVEHAHQQ